MLTKSQLFSLFIWFVTLGQILGLCYFYIEQFLMVVKQLFMLLYVGNNMQFLQHGRGGSKITVIFTIKELKRCAAVSTGRLLTYLQQK